MKKKIDSGQGGEMKTVYRFGVFTELFLILMWLLLVLSVSSVIIPTAESKILACLLAGVVGLLGVAAILWIWRGTMKALKEGKRKKEEK